MNKYNSHYKSFNVMDGKEHWDPHTREIVERRLTYYQLPKDAPFNDPELQTLYSLCATLLDETREQVIYYVLHHFQSKLHSDIGEAQRKKDIPKQSVLISEGLNGLNLLCSDQYGSSFSLLDDGVKKNIISEMLQGTISFKTPFKDIPVKEFIKSVLKEAVSSYYSHPQIWSEIGYAGPAYPRGYIRSERGLTDPWEAQRKNEESS